MVQGCLELFDPVEVVRSIQRVHRTADVRKGVPGG